MPRAFRDAKPENVAIIYALSLLPLLVAAGAAVDLSRALVVRSRLAQALDAAGLAVGATVNLTQQQAQDLATKYFDANYPAAKLGVPGQLIVNQNGQTIDLQATASVDTTLMYLVGINKLDVGVSSEIVRNSNNIEVAMMLDVTGSMSGSRRFDSYSVRQPARRHCRPRQPDADLFQSLPSFPGRLASMSVAPMPLRCVRDHRCNVDYGRNLGQRRRKEHHGRHEGKSLPLSRPTVTDFLTATASTSRMSAA